MATAQDALDAVTAMGNRIDLMEAGPTNMTTQLANITQQLAALIGAPPPTPGPGPRQPSTRRRLDPSTMEKLYGDASTSLLRSWRNRWDDHTRQPNRWQRFGCASTLPCSNKPRPPGGSGGSRYEHGGGGNKTDGGIAPKTKMARIRIGNVKAKHRDRRTPTIAVEILDGNGISARSFANVTPDPGAEVSVGLGM
ncbi:hypothetical protein DAPPUDRAFT_114150 [Daphnia pulex]|uniref:Uncharacterized protein n=1 Tax=Daphnia pulex TaxID=6669 RepID=E9HH69_DAPPU|nr:hypothetical protein DAPPUDRAFT_114150 [Daphnia pulex]|eukprot:EFX68915.1 hypothetical protein DAPPUDRAFT_114150 [Daphnia pulex]